MMLELADAELCKKPYGDGSIVDFENLMI